MRLGTSNGLMVLAVVTPERQLLFYEQPDPSDPQIFLDRYNRFNNSKGSLLQPGYPPVGETAILSGHGRIIQPFDRARVPACFIQHVAYFPATNRIKINSI